MYSEVAWVLVPFYYVKIESTVVECSGSVLTNFSQKVELNHSVMLITENF